MFSVEGDGGGVRSLVHGRVRHFKLPGADLTHMVLDVASASGDGDLHVTFTSIVDINCNVDLFV